MGDSNVEGADIRGVPIELDECFPVGEEGTDPGCDLWGKAELVDYVDHVGVVYIVEEAFDVKHECRGFEAFLLGGFNVVGKGDPSIYTGGVRAAPELDEGG